MCYFQSQYFYGVAVFDSFFGISYLSDHILSEEPMPPPPHGT